MSRRLLVAGNWKQNGTVASTRALTAEIIAGLTKSGDGAEYLICPAFLHMAAVSQAVQSSPGVPLQVGSQDCGVHPDGAFTGDVGAGMLVDAGCSYAIVGHSERRQLFGDTDALVAQKFGVAQEAGLVPILCVGETLEERESGKLEQVIHRQLDAVLSTVWSLENATSTSLPVIAYEPVWAIGTGKTASPEEAQEVHHLIRSRLADNAGQISDQVRIVYGGSVKPDNAAELFAQSDIDGGLIGGASLKAPDFLSIGKAADQLMRNGL